MSTVRANAAHKRKEEWKGQLQSLREKIAAINEKDHKRSLEETATRISRKIIAHNGEPLEYKEINDAIKDLDDAIKATHVIIAWQQRIQTLHQKMELLDQAGHTKLDKKIEPIHALIKAYKGNSRAAEEINAAIQALESDVKRIALLQNIEHEDLRRMVPPVDVKPVTPARPTNPPASSGGLLACFSVFCCWGPRKPVTDKTPLLQEQRGLKKYN